jgi:hypothetical protein
VRSVTAEAVYVDRGALDGVREGQVLTFSRGNKQVGTCTVTATSERFARCSSAALKVGDRFAVARKAAGKPLAPEDELDDEERARRAALLSGATWRLRDFDGAGSATGGPRAEVLLSHTTYAGAPNGAFGVQRLDVLLHDVDVWQGLRISADLTALNFSARSPDSQTVYQSSPVLLVRQLELGFHRADVPFSAALGRTRLLGGTGLMVVDGAQAGWRFGGGVEVGAYGGLLPDAARLTIDPAQWGAGAFTRVRASVGEGASGTLVQVDARAGWAQRTALGGRAEVGVTGSVWAGTRVDAHAELELGFGKTQAVAGIDAARVDLGLRPSEQLRLNADVRYRGLPLSGLVELGTLSPGNRAVHTDANLLWEATPQLFLSVQGGLAKDFDSALLQARVGPELSVPRVGTLPFGFSVGYLEELGWVRGRDAYLQTAVTATSVVRVLTRVAWFQQQLVSGTEGLAGHELGASVAVEVTPWRFVKARVYVMGRLPLAQTLAPLGSAGVQLAGVF